MNEEKLRSLRADVEALIRDPDGQEFEDILICFSENLSSVDLNCEVTLAEMKRMASEVKHIQGVVQSYK